MRPELNRALANDLIDFEQECRDLRTERAFRGTQMPWFGVRSVYRLGGKPDGTNLYEERVVCVEAPSFDDALAKSHAEAQAYASDNGFTWYPVTVAYEQEGDRLIDGYEVWSELFESRENLESFWQNRYERFEYHPDLPESTLPHQEE